MVCLDLSHFPGFKSHPPYHFLSLWPWVSSSNVEPWLLICKMGVAVTMPAC